MAAPEEPEALARTARRRSRAVSPRAHAEPQTAPRAPSSSQRKRQEPGGDLRGPSSQCADRIEPAIVTSRAERYPRPGKKKRYLDGAIVRVALKNFVTYDSVEVRPGPNLNMIIGPNGTGKSTIVCAIALGLGGGTNVRLKATRCGYWSCFLMLSPAELDRVVRRAPPRAEQLLARAREISDFVKHGRDRASIEIELRHHDCNIVIKRSISRKNNTSSWAVNGKPSSHKAVLATVSELNVQVDNLW
ncbi:MAG: P-loop containing nucleoside triphosphate hydrolase protein [Olpidium bornovanus]|uniref:Structural maintenance of chromosomes protein 5 n=1 Tax=Olpidium bornovanus TaxID=278681 RepID=A0A8H8DFA8_9FUNG|nr:MAG: P-loop containing nucleoside triphosphate hydrolase protein [Olpidium bornovanus]